MPDRQQPKESEPVNIRLLLLPVLLLGLIAGYGFASLDDDTVVEAAVADAIAAVTPEPTPEPTPIPTPWIVSVAPPECIDAIEQLAARSVPDLQFIVDIYDAYLDYPDENLTQFGARVETLLNALQEPPSDAETTELLRQVDVCRAAAR
jgi:hypothetical protein